MALFGLFSKENPPAGGAGKEKLDQGLKKTREGVFSKLTKAVIGKSKVDAEIGRAHV